MSYGMLTEHFAEMWEMEDAHIGYGIELTKQIW